MKFQEAVYETKLCEQVTSVLAIEVAGICLTLTEPVLSHARQRCPLNVELTSTGYFTAFHVGLP